MNDYFSSNDTLRDLISELYMQLHEESVKHLSELDNSTILNITTQALMNGPTSLDQATSALFIFLSLKRSVLKDIIKRLQNSDDLDRELGPKGRRRRRR
jgi:hypothetical protein